MTSSMWLQYIGINILRTQTKGVTHKCLFGRFFIELVPLSGARKPMENRPGKGRNQVKAVIKSDYSYSSPSPSSPNFYPIVDKVLPFISRFWTEISALDSGTNSVQNRPNKHLWVTPFVCVLSIFIPIYCNHIDDGTCLKLSKMKTKGVVHKCLFGRFSIPLSALSGATIPVQNRPVKGRNDNKTGQDIRPFRITILGQWNLSHKNE